MRDERRSEAGKRAQQWYRSKRWHALRGRQLKRHPLCQCPHHRGKDTAVKATLVDHRTPHRGDARLFWDGNNLQSMAKPCHDRYKQSLERGGVGFLGACDASGMPLDPSHPWHAEAIPCRSEG